MDNEELYLYGALLALAQDQQEAITKLTSGSLGFFGKSRIQSRGREIGKFISKIENHKKKVGIKNLNENILADLELIKSGAFPKSYSNDVIDMIKNYL
tara:strand:+ start:643 stop:936 length:294 start_codon:yes stop_codon:yes gene_type:complete